MQESLWWWQCSGRYIISLLPHLHSPVPNKPYGLCGYKAPWKKECYLVFEHIIKFIKRNEKIMGLPLSVFPHGMKVEPINQSISYSINQSVSQSIINQLMQSIMYRQASNKSTNQSTDQSINQSFPALPSFPHSFIHQMVHLFVSARPLSRTGDELFIITINSIIDPSFIPLFVHWPILFFQLILSTELMVLSKSLSFNQSINQYTFLCIFLWQLFN